MDELRLRRSLVRLRHRIELRDRPVYVFHHIPKTGGVSVRHLLANWFYRIGDYERRIDPTDFWSPRESKPPVDLSSLRSNDCLVGHWSVPGRYLRDRYQEVLVSDRFRLFCIVREPLDLQLSLYHWEQRQGKLVTTDLEMFLLERPNFQAGRFPCTEHDWREVIGRYEFVGLTNRLQESMDILAELFRKPRVRVPHLNGSRQGVETRSFSSDFLAEFRRANALNYEIYEYAARQVDELRVRLNIQDQ